MLSPAPSSEWANDRVPHVPGHGNGSKTASLCYDYANYYIGERPQPGAPFRADLPSSAPLDWSAFTPVEDINSPNLTFATSKGMQQFGCCPKSAGDATRRVLFGWVSNGWNQGGGRASPQAPNNTLSLPRDLSVTNAGLLRQRFVPELRALRLQSGHVHLGARPLALGGIAKAVRVASGRQVEILATFRVPMAALRAAPTGARQFGLLLLASSSVASDSGGGSGDVAVYDAGNSTGDGAGHGREGAGADSAEEYTSITFDATRGHLLLDRRRSGAAINSDVRGGPWPGATSGTKVWRDVTLHAYVRSLRVQPVTPTPCRAFVSFLKAAASAEKGASHLGSNLGDRISSHRSITRSWSSSPTRRAHSRARRRGRWWRAQPSPRGCSRAAQPATASASGRRRRACSCSPSTCGG